MTRPDVIAIKDIPVCEPIITVPVNTCGTIYRVDEDTPTIVYVKFETGHDIIVKLGEDVRQYG